ncbi:biopolymer transporter ExbB [Aliiroseovarius subalbicans]|uniref:biopolymer transporter ExbB n=1 Tax=Aliiroseovarius subalbicans TaxID=2925840 RepID=UPI001F574F37|nr:biopolymer transporter ExbB [Aliiroseovarius subalbicans]MCI2400606.1 biopolymer transporter ExbB [Aliiroseovarius subalbicans]
MDQPDRSPQGAEPFFTRPRRQIVLMLFVLGLVGVGGFFALPSVMPVFLANLYLNAFILFVFVIGLLACFWQVWQIFTSVGWIEGFAEERTGHDLTQAPRLLAPLAALLRSRGARMQIGAASSRSILDSVATRIDEARDITRYITNLLIFLGLLGTFFGLATTVPAVVETIRSLAPSEGEGGVEVFNRLMTGLEAQLGGMGTAFSSSLLGLAGSLVVGLLELFAGHGQNRFYRELEEWLSTITKLGFAPGDGEAGDAGMAGALAAHMSEQMDGLQALLAQSETARAEVDDRLGRLAAGVETMASRIVDESSAAPILTRIADGQERMIALMETREEDGGTGTDAESRMRLRSIDVQLLRILEEMSAGRQESLAELRMDIAKLTKALRQSGRG